MTSGQISSGLDLTYAPSTITTKQPAEGELDLLFEAMYDDYIGGQPSSTPRIVLAAQAHQIRLTLTTSTSIEDTAPTPTPTNSSSQALIFPNSSQDVDRLNSQQQQQHAQQQINQAPIQPKTFADNVPNSMFDVNTFVNPFATSSTSAAESSSLQYNHFFKGTTDLTLFIRRFVDDILVVQVYIDDIIFGSTHHSLQVNQSPYGIFINQSNYVFEILKKYGMQSCDPVDADYARCKDTFKSTSGRA
nr:hypothetical protein [Tanacetum cinerariifolium]